MRSITPVKRVLRACTAAAFWLIVWQVCALLVGRELILPAPLTVLERLGVLAKTGAFWQTALASLWRIVIGLAWGTAAGVALAVLTSASRWADTLLSPAIRVVRSTPVASFILLVLLWTTRGAVPPVISGLMVLPVVWENVRRGIAQCDPKLLELARACRFSRWKTARLVYLPAALPHFFSALTTAAGLAWKSGVAAEVLCLPRPAIGTQIYETKLYLETPDLFAWTLTVIALSLVLERLVRLLLRRAGEGAAA